MTRDSDDACDLIQQSALNALASSNVPNDPQAARAWLFRILRTACIDQYRRAKVRIEDGSAIQLDEAGWSYDDQLIAWITVRQGLTMIDP
ncbi:sigma factor, partial [Acinetobacter baumannii]